MAHTLLSTRPRGERDLAHDVLVHGGLDARGPLGPRNPEAAGGEDHPGQRVDAALELTALGEKGDDDVGRPSGLVFDHDTGRKVFERPRGRSNERKRRAWHDPQLLWQRRSAVSGHGPGLPHSRSSATG